MAQQSNIYGILAQGEGYKTSCIWKAFYRESTLLVQLHIYKPIHHCQLGRPNNVVHPFKISLNSYTKKWV